MKVPKKGGGPKGHPPFNVNGEGGRPIKYTKEFIEAEATALEHWMQQPGSIYFKRFAFERGYSPQRLPEFAAVSERFSDTFERARDWQEIRLVEGGLLDEFNASFTKFILCNICGFAEKTESKISSDSENPFSIFLKSIDGTSKELVDET